MTENAFLEKWLKDNDEVLAGFETILRHILIASEYVQHTYVTLMKSINWTGDDQELVLAMVNSIKALLPDENDDDETKGDETNEDTDNPHQERVARSTSQPSHGQCKRGPDDPRPEPVL